jgi:hypothetical protein
MMPFLPVSSRLTRVALTVAMAVALSAVVIAWQQTPAKVPTVAPDSLQALLPAAINGWTKGRINSDRVAASDSCTYVIADVVYLKDGAKMRITLADTGFDTDALFALATMVMTLPPDHSGVVPPDTTVTRLTYRDAPAATLWTPSKREAEFVVVVGGRFIAKAEGTQLDGLDGLRGALDLIDLAKVAQLSR